MKSDPLLLQQAQQYGAQIQCLVGELNPLLRKMHLLSSNAVSAAARAGSDGNAFRVLTQSIEQLCQEINLAIKEIDMQLDALARLQQPDALNKLVYRLSEALAVLPVAVKKGEYLAICSSVEAVHVEGHVDSFESVAQMLKQLIDALRQHTQQHKQVMDDLQALLH